MPNAERDVRAVVRGAAFAAGLASVIGLPLSGAVAQGSNCAHDARIASALDNFRVAWVASKGRLSAEDGSEGTPTTPDSHGTPWERVTDEAHDGVDSLRSGPIGDNEHTELTARIEGPATLRFWWKVDSQERADFLSFIAVPESETSVASETSRQTLRVTPISGKQGWTKVEVRLSEEMVYRVRWTYVKDSSRHAGADAGWIDGIEVEGTSYGETQIKASETPKRLREIILVYDSVSPLPGGMAPQGYVAEMGRDDPQNRARYGGRGFAP